MRRRFFSCLFLALWCGGVWMFLDWAALPPAAPTDDWGARLDWNTFFSRHVLPAMPVASPFNFPVRPPDGQGAFVAKPFAAKGHAGEDWNTAPGDGDLGEPVLSPADGLVVVALDFQGGWGKVVLVDYRMPEGSDLPAVEMMFAQLGELDVKAGDFVRGGQLLGKIGNADGAYAAHLHWEARKVLGLGLGGAYADDLSPWLNPSAFVAAHHGGRPSLAKSLPASAWEKWGDD